MRLKQNLSRSRTGTGVKIDIYLTGKKTDSDSIREIFVEECAPAVFESLKSYNGIVFRLGKHLDRLFESAKTIGLALPKSRKQINDEARNCAQKYKDGNYFLRLAVDGRNSYVTVLRRMRPARIYTQGVALRTAVTRRCLAKSAPSGVKTN